MASMDTIPLEVIDRIISFIVPDLVEPPLESGANGSESGKLLIPVAAASRRLKAAAERLTFRHINIKSTDLTEFSRILTPSRRACLASLTLTVILPEYSISAAVRAESRKESAINGMVYSAAIHSLFNILKQWEMEDPELVRLFSLTINHPESPSDRPWPLNYAPWTGDERPAAYDGRYLHSYIQLFFPETLPVLQSVKCLSMPRPGERWAYRNTLPNVPILLATKMPHLEEFEFSVDDDDQLFPGVRKRNRDEVATMLQGLSLPSLNRADFTFALRTFREEIALPQVLHEPNVADPLSSSIYGFALSHNLRDLTITGVLDINILGPLQTMSETPWPNLQHLEIHLYAITPSGGHFVDRPGKAKAFYGAFNNVAVTALPGNTIDETTLFNDPFSLARLLRLTPIRIFRGMASKTTPELFVNAYADALAKMPRLKASSLGCLIKHEPYSKPEWFSLAYFGPCAAAKRDPSSPMCAKCRRTTTRELVTQLLGWTPNEELMDKFRSLKADTYPEPVVEKKLATYLSERGLDTGVRCNDIPRHMSAIIPTQNRSVRGGPPGQAIQCP